MDKWKALLEQGDPLIEGSGWGEVRDLKIEDCRFKPNTKTRHLTPSLVGPRTYIYLIEYGPLSGVFSATL